MEKSTQPGGNRMVLLIAGASHTGKTALAQRLVKKYGFPCLSIDHLKMGLIRSGYTDLTPMSSDEALTDYLWPILRGMIQTVLENRQDLIVEGCYIPFDWAKDFGEEYRSRIRYSCLVMSEGYIRSHYEDIMNYASVAEQRMDDSDCTMERLLKDNAKVLEQCRRHGVPYILIDKTYEVDLSVFAASL